MKSKSKKLISILCAFCGMTSTGNLKSGAQETRTLYVQGVGKQEHVVIKNFDELKNLDPAQYYIFDESIKLTVVDENQFKSVDEALQRIDSLAEEYYQNIVDDAIQNTKIPLKELNTNTFLESLHVSYKNFLKNRLMGYAKTKKYLFMTRYQISCCSSMREKLDKDIYNLLFNYFSYIKCNKKNTKVVNKLLEDINKNYENLPKAIKEEVATAFKATMQSIHL